MSRNVISNILGARGPAGPQGPPGVQGLPGTVLTQSQLDATYAAIPIPVLEMVKPYVFGDSYGKNTNQGADSNTLWVDRLVLRHRMQILSNFAVAGTRMDQIMTSIQASWPINGRGLVFFADGCINDEKQYGDTTGTTTTAESFRTALAYLSSRAFQSAIGSAFIYGPGWSSGTSSTVASYVDFAFTGDLVYLLLNYVTGTGGTVAVKNSSGTTVKSVTTGGYKQNFTGAVKLSGFGAGNHTVRISLSSGTVTIAGGIIPAVTGANPPVIWQEPGQFNNSSTEYTRLQAYVAACEAILPDFPNVTKVVMDSGWDYNSMIGPDATHPNDKGVAYITNLAEKAMRTAFVNYQQGLNQLTGSTNSATYITPAVSYVGPGAVAPAQVTGFTANTGSLVDFTWTTPSDGGSTLTGYVLQSSPAGTNTWTTLANPVAGSNTYSVSSGLTASTSYDFRIAATNSVGTGVNSATATTTTGAPTVTYSADTFTRANGALGSTETGSYAWASVGGTNSISSNMLSFDSVVNAGNGATVLINDAHNNGTFKLTRKGSGSGIGGLFFLGDATTFTGYVVWQSGSNYALSKRTAQNAYTQLGVSSGVTPASGDVITVIVNGTSITVKINGVTVITVTDSSYSGTYHGGWSQGATTLDDFSHTSATS